MVIIRVNGDRLRTSFITGAFEYEDTRGTHEKDPSDSFVTGFDWSQILPPGVEIASRVFTITGPDAVLTKADESDGPEQQMPTVRLSAGTQGETYLVACKIVTNETTQQTIERSFQVYVRQR